MNKARFTTGLILLILLALLIQMPQATAITPQNQTIGITDTHDDKFITETGIGIDSQLCHILDPNMDIRSFLVFRGLEINWWEPLTNATLRFRTTATLDFDANSTVTIHGMKYSDLQLEGVLNPSWVLSVPITEASVDVNTSQFYGQTSHEVNVTSIVEELKQSIRWDGDGADGTETGDAIGFIIYGAEGYDTRWFIDYLYGTPSLAPQLVIHWNHEPSPPSEYPDASFNGTYRGYNIWNNTIRGDKFLNYYWEDTVDTYYQNSTATDYWTLAYPGDTTDYPYCVSQWKIGTVDDWIIIADSIGLSGQVNITWSDDYFEENRYYSLPNDNWDPELSNWAGRRPSLWIDEDGLIHIVYSTPTVWEADYYNIIYLTFNILANGSIQYSESFENVTVGETHCTSPDMYVQENGTVHVSYHKANVYYRKKWPNGTWTSEVQVSPHAIEEYHGSLIVASETTGDALIAWTYNNDLWWNYVFSNMTVGGARNTDRDCYRPAMVSHRADDVTHIAYGDSNVQPGEVKYSYKAIDNSSSWAGEQTVSPSDELYHYTSMGVDEGNNTIHIVFLDGWHTHIDHNSFQIGDTPSTVPTIISTETANPRLEPYPEKLVDTIFWIVTYENGTIVVDNLDDLDDAIDWIDSYDPDPEDPDPGGVWSTGPGGGTGAFTRFRMRLWFMLIGFGCLFGPLLFFAWRRPSGYYIICGAIVMLIGIGMLLSIGQV